MSAGIAKRVRILDLARHWQAMPPKADISDWLAAGHAREQLDALIESAPDYRSDAEPKAEESGTGAAFPLFWHGDINPIESRPWLISDLVPEVGAGLIA